MVKGNHNNDNSSHYDAELEELLKLAEGLQEKCDEDTRKIELYKSALVGLGALTATLVSFLLVVWEPSSSSSLFSEVQYLYGAVIVVLALLYAYWGLRVIKRMQDRLRTNQLALSELVELLREVEAAYTESWSTLERAQFRVRLSRFGIGRIAGKKY